MRIAAPCSGHAQLLGFAPPTQGMMEEGSSRNILLETCARNVSCPSRAVSITPVPVGSAGACCLVWLGHGHLRGTVGGREGVGPK